MHRFFILILILLASLPKPLLADETPAEQFWHYWRGKYWDNWQEELRQKIEQSEFPDWMLEQIQEDLMPFQETGIDQQQIPNTIVNNFTLPFVICSICVGQVICTTYPVETARDFRAKVFMEVLEELSHCVHLPDAVFLVHIGDAFCQKASVPVFSWCKHREQGLFAVNIPDYEALSGNDNLLIAVEKGAALHPWGSKQNVAIWRGSTTGFDGPLKFQPIKTDFIPRLQLVELSTDYPQFVDAKFSMMFQEQYDDPVWRSQFEPYMGNPLQISEQLKYKYQIWVDGFVSPFSRAYWQLFSDGVIFKQESPWYQWFYRILRPYEHYIPYEPRGSDLVEKIQWAIDHDEEVQKIVRNANNFAKQNLKRSDVMLYFYLLLQEYSKLQKLGEARKRSASSAGT